VREPLVTEFRQAVRVGLSRVPRVPGPRSCTAQRPGRELLEFCRDRQDDVVRFTADTRIWPTNNISERDLRPTKTQQKISGRLTSEDTTQDRLDIRSYIDTTRKHGINVNPRRRHPAYRASPTSRHPTSADSTCMVSTNPLRHAAPASVAAVTARSQAATCSAGSSPRYSSGRTTDANSAANINNASPTPDRSESSRTVCEITRSTAAVNSSSRSRCRSTIPSRTAASSRSSASTNVTG
jgi:hypothetical protein